MEPVAKKHCKYLSLLIALLAMILIVGGTATGVWYFMDQEAKKAAEVNEKRITELQNNLIELKKLESINDVEGTTEKIKDWKTYTNNSWGISFKYPGTYTISENTVKAIGANMAGRLILIDSSRPGNPSLVMLFNPDGLGGCGLDKNDYQYYTSIKNNILNVDKKEVQSASICPDNNTYKTEFSVGKNKYTDGNLTMNGIAASFYYSQGNYQAELDQIIGTFTISKSELYGI